jgi:hypothetical protein
MRLLFLLAALLYFQNGFSQSGNQTKPISNIRLSFLLFPFTPLLTVEVRTFGNFTIQLETNFVNTHGANLKYFIKERMDGDYIFTGLALVENKLLRDDKKTTSLLYVGYGYAHRFGNKRQWTFDNRIGIGVTTNANKNSVYPVIKTGVGLVF